MATGLLAGLTGLAVLFGATTQRITGMGFALVSSPILVLLLGAASGVPVVQVLGILASITVLVVTLREVAWRKAVGLIIPALAGMVPGWLLAKALPEPVLLIVIGLMIVVAIVAMLASDRARVFKGTPGLLGAGLLSGFMNVLAGVGGPAMALYKLSTGWEHKEFVATMQVYFIALSAGTLVALGWPPLPGAVWATAVVGLGAGLVLGQWLSHRVSPKLANRLVIWVALLGAVATIIRGATSLTL